MVNRSATHRSGENLFAGRAVQDGAKVNLIAPADQVTINFRKARFLATA